MTRDEVLETVREVVVEVLGADAAAVVEDAAFKGDLGADSLDLVELVMGLEERFEVTIPEDELEGITTVGQAVDTVSAKLAVGA